MVATDAQTYLAVGLKTAVWSGEAETRRTKRIGGRQNNASVVEAAGVGRVWRATYCEVPLEKIGLEGLSCIIW